MILLLAANKKLMQNVPLNEVKTYAKHLLRYMDAEHHDLIDEINETKALSEDLEKKLVAAFKDFRA